MASVPTARWTLALAAVASCMAALDTLVVASALSTMRLDLHASVEQLEWTVNGYNLSLAVFLITAAALGDRIGRRAMFGVGLALFSLASAGCALAPDVGVLIAARVLQGAGAALILTLSLALVSAAYPAERRGAALGVYMMLTGLAVASGPVIGGAIAQGLAWQWIFWLNVPIGLLALPLVFRRVEESFGSDKGLDGAGLALITGGALGIVWALVRGNPAGFPSSQNAVVGSVPDAAIGKASGTNMMMRELGGVFGIALLVAVFAASGSYASPQSFADGFAAAIAVGAGLSVLGAIAGLAVPARIPRASTAPIISDPAMEAVGE